MPRSPLFPFVTDSICDRMHRRVVSVIQHPDFIFKLPCLSPASWKIVLENCAERERLEFLGDALIGASISEELFRCWPNEGPGFYTNARMVLTANSTFAHIMHKLGFHKRDHPVKSSGDTFETTLAAYHGERGQDAFSQYVRLNFSSLVQCAGQTFKEHRANRADELRVRKALLQQKQKHLHLSTSAALVGNAKIHQRLKKDNKIKSIKKWQREVFLNTTRQFEAAISRTPIISGPSTSCKPLAKTAVQPRVVFDLTEDSDDDVLIVTTLPPSIPKPETSVGNSKVDSNHVLLMRSHPETKPLVETKSHSILRFISVSPKKCRTAALGSNASLNAPRRVSKQVDQDVLAILSSHTSPNLPGNINNPILID